MIQSAGRLNDLDDNWCDDLHIRRVDNDANVFANRRVIRSNVVELKTIDIRPIR